MKILIRILLFSVCFNLGQTVWAMDSMSDHKAQIFRAEGNVRVLKAGTFLPAEKGMILEQGDQIITGEDSFLEIAYDDKFLNIARIDSNTKAEFRGIEPTDLHLEDGSVFSALDGLKAGGGEYQVSTPTAVAAVRGTHFDVMYDMDTKAMETAVIPDIQDHISSVEITPLGGTQILAPFIIEEGQQIDFNPAQIETGASPQPGPVDPAKMERVQMMLDQMLDNADTSSRSGNGDQTAESAADENKEGDDQGSEQDDGDQKIGGGPNPPSDGGGPGDRPGDGPGGDSGTMNRNEVDGFVDALIPRDDVPLPGTVGNTEGPEMPGRDSGQGANQGGAADAPRAGSSVDFGQMMQFFSTGGAFAGDDQKTSGPSDMSGIFGAMGYGPEMAERMTQGMMSIMTHENFDPTNFVGTGTAFAGPQHFPMESVLNHFRSDGTYAGPPEGGLPTLPDGLAGDFSTRSFEDINQTIQQAVNDFILTGDLLDSTRTTTILTMDQRLDIYRYSEDLFDQMFNLITQLEDANSYLDNAIANSAYNNTSPGLSVTTPIAADIKLYLTQIQHESSTSALVNYKIVQGTDTILRDSTLSPGNTKDFPQGHCTSTGCSE